MDPILKRLTESKTHVKQLQEEERVAKERIGLLEKIVFDKESGSEHGRFKVLDDIWCKIAELEHGPKFAEDRIKLQCRALVQEEFADSKVLIREFNN